MFTRLLTVCTVVTAFLSFPSLPFWASAPELQSSLRNVPDSCSLMIMLSRSAPSWSQPPKQNKLGVSLSYKKAHHGIFPDKSLSHIWERSVFLIPPTVSSTDPGRRSPSLSCFLRDRHLCLSLSLSVSHAHTYTCWDAAEHSLEWLKASENLTMPKLGKNVGDCGNCAGCWS